jgi:hypothetical protein
MTVRQTEAMTQADPEHVREIHFVALLDDWHRRGVGAGRRKLARRGC